MELTKKYLQEQYIFHEGNYNRHLGNALELEKQFKQVQSELNYELDQMELSKKESEKYNQMIVELQSKIEQETQLIKYP